MVCVCSHLSYFDITKSIPSCDPGNNAVTNSSHFQAASKDGEIEATTDKATSTEPPSAGSLDGESAAEDDILESSQKPLSEELTPKECFHVSPQLRLSC